jgi:hypothetical protein
MSSSEFFAWVVECDASWDGAVAEAPNRTSALAEKSLAEEQRHHKTAMQEKALADEANEQRWATARYKALADEANERRQAAAREKALADEANKQCQAPARQKALAKDKRRQEESVAIWRILVQCALLAAPLNAILAEIERDNIAHEANKQCRANTREKALADEANERSRAATRKKALADKVNKQRRHVMAVRENALADSAYEQRYQELANVSPPPHRPTTYNDAVLSTMGGSLHAKSLVIAPLSRPSTAIDGQLQTACQRTRPRRRIGRRHGPRAPNPHEHLLCGRQHWPRAPNQSTVNGWG